MYETFEHTADIGIRGAGGSFPEAFSEAARCVFSIMAELSSFRRDIERPFNCSAKSREELLVQFINKLLYESAVHHCIWFDFIIEEWNETHLKGLTRGWKIKTNQNAVFKTEVKAATYHQLKVYEKNNIFFAECVVDV